MPDNTRPMGLFDRLRGTTNESQALQEAAQLAIQVEFTTIPAYLTGLYSITDTASQAYQLLRSVVMEEMFHVNQAANLLVALGGSPRFTPPYMPTYPGYLPHANPATTPMVGLYRASADVFENVFAAIETPAPPGAPPEGDNYDTIGQLYDAVALALAAYKGPYMAAPGCRQRTDIYLGKFGGKAIEVVDFKSAAAGVKQVVQQGEGSLKVGEQMNPGEPWGAYNHYGMRSDGTYGPIIGTPYEMSHFKKFRTVALNKAAFPPTSPITSNPREEDFSNPVAKQKARMFDSVYSIMLLALELTFKVQPKGAPDPYFAVAIPLMHHCLPNMARSLMTTPANVGGDSSVGPNAAPTFLYRKGLGFAAIVGEITQAMDLVRKRDPSGSARDADLQLLTDALDSIKTIEPAAKALGL